MKDTRPARNAAAMETEESSGEPLSSGGRMHQAHYRRARRGTARGPMVYWGAPGRLHHEALRPSPSTPGPSRAPGARCCAPCSPRAARAPRHPTPTRPPSSRRSRQRGRPATSRAGSPSGISRAPEQKALEEDTVRAAFSSDETVLSFLRRPSPAEGARRFDADVQVFAATEPRAQVSYWRPPGREARGGLGHRGPPGSGTDRRPGPPVARPEAWRARGVSAAARGLRAADGGRDPLLDARHARADGLRLRGPRAGPLHASPALPSASSSGSSPAGRRSIARSAGPSSACTPPTSTV